MHPQIIRLPEVKALTGLGRSTIYALIKSGAFPAPHKITLGLPRTDIKGEGRLSGWERRAVDDWISSRIGGNPKAAA
jgi:prophage regulatory protein